MKKFIRFFNQNRKGIIKIIIIIAFTIIIIEALGNIMQPDKNNNKFQSNIKDNDKPYQSVITGEKIPEELTQENTYIIKQFVNYCNNKQVEKAYSMLTEECKGEFNNNIDIFKTNYYNRIFTKKRVYNLELWINESNYYTYKIKYYEDNLLATGGEGINNNIEDYITITKQNNESKLNINGFIKKEIINKSKNVEDVEILVNSKKVYKSYETYNITITNYTLNTVLINDGQTPEDICLIDKNDIEYLSFIEDLPEYNLYVNKKSQVILDIDFNKVYDPYRVIKKIKFRNIMLKDELNKTIEMTIDI